MLSLSPRSYLTRIQFWLIIRDVNNAVSCECTAHEKISKVTIASNWNWPNQTIVKQNTYFTLFKKNPHRSFKFKNSFANYYFVFDISQHSVTSYFQYLSKLYRANWWTLQYLCSCNWSWFNIIPIRTILCEKTINMTPTPPRIDPIESQHCFNVGVWHIHLNEFLIGHLVFCYILVKVLFGEKYKIYV